MSNSRSGYLSGVNSSEKFAPLNTLKNNSYMAKVHNSRIYSFGT